MSLSIRILNLERNKVDSYGVEGNPAHEWQPQDCVSMLQCLKTSSVFLACRIQLKFSLLNKGSTFFSSKFVVLHFPLPLSLHLIEPIPFHRGEIAKEEPK